MTHIPAEVIAEDSRLDDAASNAQEALAALRWHWTLDESNPDRVTIRQYARDVGHHHSAIHRMAQGYAAWKGGDPGVTTLGEAIRRASDSNEREAVTDAVAAATGRSYTATRKRNISEVKAVHDAAREKAEANGTTVEEEAPAIAERRQRLRDGQAASAKRRKERTPLRVTQALANLETAHKAITSALYEVRSVDLDDDEREVLADDAGRVFTVLNLFKAAIAESTNIDWDAELADLTERN